MVISSGEFRLKTATDTYLDQPGRGRVLAAKALAAVAAGTARDRRLRRGGTVIIGSALLVTGATLTTVGRFLPCPGAIAAIAAVTVVLAVAAALTTVRRDVT